MMNILTAEFPEVMKQFTIGKSYEGRNISAFLIGLNLTSKNLTLARPMSIITGAHHAREISTISMSTYTVLRLLYNYQKNDTSTI